MHPIARSAADILASASARPAPPKKSRKPAKVNPFASDTRFTQFSLTATASKASTPGSESVPVPFHNISTETGTSGPYIPPSTFKFVPISTPETFLTALTARGEELEGEEDGHIADSGYFEEFNSISMPLEIFETDSSDRDCLKAPPPKTFKTRAQRFEDVLGILREGHLSPFDLMVELLDDSNLKYWAYRNELYKEENKKLSEILELIFSNAPGKEKLTEWMLPHALEVICGKVSDEMDVVQEAERLPGLDAITPEFIKAWRVSGHQEKAPCLFEILSAAAETKEKNKKKSPLAESQTILDPA